GQDILVSLPDAPVWLDADPLRLVQAFGNLINNACKFTEPGGRIALAAEVHGDEVAVALSDSGIGIAADQLSAIFDMFTQVDQSLHRTHGGLGIGLTLVRQLVEMHGGTVDVTSDGPGHGSTFFVRLPLADAVPGERAPDASRANAA
ncbi:MAG: ATP-binding protein, partial [Pseudomonadota bacterium]|nr:ATP-binding protein [Pseudomonadota bacterium]